MRSVKPLVVPALAVAAVLLAVGSPLFLWLVSRWKGVDWSQLANIGEAYGAASAVFSALAVAGVAASLLYRNQQLRLTRLHHVRSVQRELFMRVVDEPDLGKAVNLFGDTDESPRHRAFIVAFLQYLYLAYDAGVATNTTLDEEVFPRVLRSEEVRRFWHDHRLDWIRGRLIHVFCEWCDLRVSRQVGVVSLVRRRVRLSLIPV